MKKEETNPMNVPEARAINEATLTAILTGISDVKDLFKKYVTTLTPEDRQRLSSVSLKRRGFVEAVELLWKNNLQFAPGYVPVNVINDLNNDYQRYLQIIAQAQIVVDMATDAHISLSDQLYRYSLAFYENVKRAAQIDRVPEAEPLFDQLSVFFKRQKSKKDDEPTQEQVIRDAKALLKGTKEGEVIVRNKAAEESGGEHTVIDNTHPTD